MQIYVLFRLADLESKRLYLKFLLNDLLGPELTAVQL